MTIPPVFILNSGRCGSTMVSQMLNLHPRILSLSEFFCSIPPAPASIRRRASGTWFWKLISQQKPMLKALGRDLENVSEVLYPITDPNARFNSETTPPILLATLPHLTDDYETVYDELGPIVQSQPKRAIVDHFRWLFGWLADRFGGDLWVERSGGSINMSMVMLRHFPEARVIHLYRDGRNTAISMSHHPSFRSVVATIKYFESKRINILNVLKLFEESDFLTSSYFHLGFKLPSNKLPHGELKIADFGRFWTSQMSIAQRVLGGLPPDRLLNMKYEDILENPEAQLRRMIRFIHPSLDDTTWVRDATSVCRPPAGPPKYKSLSPADQRMLEEACRPGLELLGYKTGVDQVSA